MSEYGEATNLARMSAHSLQIEYIGTALSDLNEILLYTEVEWGAHQRKVYRPLILRTLNTLALSPAIGRSHDNLMHGLRSYPVGSHVLFYWTTESTLVVARVMHARRDATQQDWSLDGTPTDEDADTSE